MSDLQKAWAKRKLDGIPEPLDPIDEPEEDSLSELPEHIDDGDSSSASSASSTGTIIPSPSQKLFARSQGSISGGKGGASGGRSWEPIPWTAYFERELFLTPEDGTGSGEDTPSPTSITHHVYLTSPSPEGGPLFVTHHGAGSSGLSFAPFTSEIRKIIPKAGVLSLDARGHGSTTIKSAPGGAQDVGTNTSSTQPSLDLSLETLTNDLYNIITLTQKQMSWPQLPNMILVGHSLGGSVVTSLAKEPRDIGLRILGHAVLDVVEGSAIDALQSMQSYLTTRPTGFTSVESGIEWHVRSRTLRNSTSARISVPSLLVHDDGTGSNTPKGAATPGDAQPSSMDECAATSSPSSSAPAAEAATATTPSRPWRWRTDLAATQPFWEGWFVGLSRKFLEAKGGKLLLLAGTDRLDTELTIGQMQGKYALQVFPEAGHFIQEDLPEKTAVALADFFKRNDRSALVLPPKVSDMIRQGKRV